MPASVLPDQRIDIVLRRVEVEHHGVHEHGLRLGRSHHRLLVAGELLRERAQIDGADFVARIVHLEVGEDADDFPAAGVLAEGRCRSAGRWGPDWGRTA